jgi:hypothetical protein
MLPVIAPQPLRKVLRADRRIAHPFRYHRPSGALPMAREWTAGRRESFQELSLR